MKLPNYTKEQLQFLERDKDFQRRVAVDEELNALFDPSDGNEERDAVLRSLGSNLNICGIPVPPPTLGALRLLTAVGSQFVNPAPDFTKDPYGEVSKALFVLCSGPAAVPVISSQYLLLDKLQFFIKMAEATGNGIWLDKYLVAQAEITKDIAAFEHVITKFATRYLEMPFGKTIVDVIKDINAYLSAAMTGFRMLPDKVSTSNDDGVQKMLWDNDHESNLLALIWEVNPSAKIDELRWGIPLVTLGFMAARGAQKRGVPAVMRKSNGDACLERLSKLMDARLKEVGK